LRGKKVRPVRRKWQGLLGKKKRAKTRQNKERFPPEKVNLGWGLPKKEKGARGRVGGGKRALSKGKMHRQCEDRGKAVGKTVKKREKKGGFPTGKNLSSRMGKTKFEAAVGLGKPPRGKEAEDVKHRHPASTFNNSHQPQR